MPYHHLDVYRKAYDLAIEIHKETLSFPKIEQYALAQQLRASSKSIPANIAEGMGRQESKADVRHFIKMSIGSCDETRVWLEFAKDLNYISTERQKFLNDAYCEIGRMLSGIIRRYS